MLELTNQLLIDMTPIYIYVSFFLSMMYVYHGFALSTGMRQQQEMLMQKWHAAEFSLLPDTGQLVVHMEIRNWINGKKKRLDAPDDDTDGDSFSEFLTTNKILGGLQWKESLYSPSLLNIVS